MKGWEHSVCIVGMINESTELSATCASSPSRLGSSRIHGAYNPFPKRDPDMNVRIPTLLLAIAAALLVAGCGDDSSPSSKDADDSATTTTATTATTTTGETTPDDAATEGTVLELKNDGDNLAYDKTELTAPAGEITIKLTNDSAIPHDIVVEGNEDDASELIADGKSTETTVTLKPGTYTYYCTPHKAAGMVGTLTVT